MATRILTADGATITVEPTGTGKLARLRVSGSGFLVVAVLDRDDLDALAEACAALAEELPPLERTIDAVGGGAT